ncbi:Neutrophil collagenase [Vulpes lagopus]
MAAFADKATLDLRKLPLLLLLCVQLSHTFPVHGESPEEKSTRVVQESRDYLEKFYQLPRNRFRSERKNSTSVIMEKLREMQRFFGLNETGKPNQETLEMMQKPRCGVPDSGDFMLTPGNPKWKQTNLTYRIIKYTPQLSEASVETAIQKAFQVWSNVSPLTFTKVSQGEADIRITFIMVTIRHLTDPMESSLMPFSRAKVLEEMFTLMQKKHGPKILTDYNLFLVAAHEFGHSLGLSHSTDPGALMYPNYVFHDPSTYTLPQDDINGIQTIYGYFWRRHPQLPRVDLNFISLFWPSLPDGIQAAYEDVDKDLVFLFKGRQYWALSGYDIKQGYPKDISDYGFPSSVQAIDAAVYYRRKTYFFVNDQVWRYDNQRQSMEPGYPKSIASIFPGIESTVDAVFQQNLDQDIMHLILALTRLLGLIEPTDGSTVDKAEAESHMLHPLSACGRKA